jgi:transcriptional regulator with XRE-family HTH domain
MSPNEESDANRPFRSSALANYLDKQIEALKGVKTQRDIAREIGYDKPTMISMFKTGEAKVPLEKIPALAKALHVDPAHLFRLALEQYWPNVRTTIAEIFGRMASANEEEIFLKKWREATKGADPKPSAKLDAVVDRMIREALVDS